jgi:hypothetical protein
MLILGWRTGQLSWTSHVEGKLRWQNNRQQVSTLDTNLSYHVIIASDQPDRYGTLRHWVWVVPIDWIDLTSKYVRYPHPAFHLYGTFPQDWSDMFFSRRRFPTIRFVEFISNSISSRKISVSSKKCIALLLPTTP